MGKPRENRQPSPRLMLAIVTGFVLLQQAIPLASRLRAHGLAPADFSWDMFGSKVECSELSAQAVLADGRRKTLNLESAFPKWSQLRRLLSEPRLSTFTHYVCAGMKQKHGAERELRLSIACHDVGGGASVRLASTERNWCAPSEEP